MTVTKKCACGCGEALPAGAHALAKYVDAKHRRRMEARRRRARQRDESKPRRFDAKPTEDQGFAWKSKVESKDGRASARRGPGYEKFRQTEWPDRIISGEASHTDAQRALGETGANVSRWMAAYYEDMALGKARDGWEQADDVQTAMLDYEAFTRRFHPEAEIPGYHLEWEQEIDGVVGTGGRLCLLAPQRHGKTEFLIRYCQRRIAEDPNICILWVSRAKELAEESVGLLRQYLEQEDFCEAVLGPGETFKPDTRSGRSWTDEKFTVAQRDRPRKSPTVRALGIGGTTSGRDADIIIVDDPQEREDCESPTTNEKQFRWFVTTLAARKMSYTGLALITSHRHMKDIPKRLMRDHAEDWRFLVYQAHDPTCTIPESREDEHVDCLLWPNAPHIDFKFLMGQKRADPAFYQCNYMNDPKTDGTVVITAEDIDVTKDHERRAGDIPRGVARLVAGIDPADAKPVAAVLWGFESDWGDKNQGRRHVIDIMEAEPGVRGAREILSGWKQRYGCTLFVVESNMAQSWWQDKEIREITDGQVMLKPHYTDRTNKWSTSTGVVAMFAKMRAKPHEITIPWGDDQSRQLMDRLVRSFLAFDPNHPEAKHNYDDLCMAAWFPQPTMDAWVTPTTAWAEKDYRSTPYVAGRTPFPTRQMAAA